MIGSGRKSVRKEIEDNFTSLPRGCYIELEKVAKEHILSNLKQYRVDKRGRSLSRRSILRKIVLLKCIAITMCGRS